MAVTNTPCSDPTRTRTDRLVSALVLIGAVAALGTLAVRLGSDANGDLRNYHYYGGWALLNKPVGFDIAPAQLQTYIHPLLDTLLYYVLSWLNAFPRLFTFVWAVPQGVAVWGVYHIARLVFAGLPVAGRTGLSVAAALIGGSSAAPLAVVGTSMSEAIPSLFMVGAIWTVLRADAAGRGGEGMMRRYAMAGLLAGAAVVLKLTMAAYLIGCVSAVLALALLEPTLPRWRGLLALGAGCAVSFAVLGGPWWLAVYRVFGNPLFPFYNSIFHSPYYPPVDLFDTRFLPHGLWETLTYPAFWAFRWSTRTSELPMRDPRMLLEVIASLFLIGWGLLSRWRGGAAALGRVGGLVWCAVFGIVAYATWLKSFSILRYAATLEMMSGVLILGALALATAPILPRLGWPRVAGATALAAGLLAALVLPRWDRNRVYQDRVISTDVPQLPGNSTVFLLSPIEMAFVAAFEPASVRFIGLNNNLVNPNHPIGLETLITRAVATADGPLWSISDPGPLPAAAVQSLREFGLRRTDECRPVVSSIAPVMSLCRVERLPQS